MKTVDKDLGYKRILLEINKLKKGVYVDTGFFEDTIHNNSETETVADVAIANEFGIGVPERSFVRSSFDSEHKVWSMRLRNKIYALRPSLFSAERILAMAGSYMEKSYKNKITNGSPHWKALSPVTIRRKGFDNPLIDTRQMFNSIKSRYKHIGRPGFKY
jgi:hypothetical protein